MKKIELEERKKIQLDVLDRIHAFCIQNDIKYTLAYGTLLGAVRHGGYIPWDDDVDIAMLRKDYDVFVKSFVDERYKVASFETSHNLIAFAKVFDNETVIVDRKASTHSLGVNVDVFPIDDAPVSSRICKWHKWHIQRLKDCNRIKLFKINKESTKLNNLIGLAGKVLLIVFPYSYFVRRIITLSKKYNGKNCNKAVHWPASGHALPLDKQLFENTQLTPFEDRHYNAIVETDKYLSNEYGDYMTPPPVEKRISYHTSDAYWK